MTEAAEAFDRAIKDADSLLARFDSEKNNDRTQGAEVLKRAGLVMALAAWETYIKDRIRHEFDVWLKSIDGSLVGKFVRKRLDEDLKRFFNPNTERTKKLFLDYFEIDITKEWAWDNYDSATARKALDGLIEKRGDAAHKANTAKHLSAEPHQVRRDDLEKAIRFLKGLVAATEKIRIAK